MGDGADKDGADMQCAAIFHNGETVFAWQLRGNAPGWESATDPTSSETYYFNRATGVAQLDRPADITKGPWSIGCKMWEVPLNDWHEASEHHVLARVPNWTEALPVQ